jgi:hypothetical protein
MSPASDDPASLRSAMPLCMSGLAPVPATDEVAVAPMTVRGTRVWMAYRLDKREWQRREACGLGPVLEWDLLDTLMDLPAGMTVPAACLRSPVRHRLATAPPGVVSSGAGGLTRTVVPAVVPLLAVVSTRDWRQGLAAASRFAVYCRRLVVATDPGEACEDMLAAARAQGTGVAVGCPGRASVLFAPPPVPGWEPTPAWWRFCEEVYGQAAAAGRAA